MLIKRILELCTDTNANETTKYKDILRYHETHAMRWQTLSFYPSLKFHRSGSYYLVLL
jgi:hypothetical protein